MSQHWLCAGEYAKVPSPEALLDRARRLYILSPLIDGTNPPVSFWADAETQSLHYGVDILQGETTVLSVSALGTLISGISTEASVWTRDSMLVERSLASAPAEARPLLELLHAQRPEWEEISYCIWRTTKAKEWAAAPGMLSDKQALRDPLGMLHWLAWSESRVLADVAEYAGARTAKQRMFRTILCSPWPEVIAAVCKMEESASPLTSRTRTVAMREWNREQDRQVRNSADPR